MKIAVSSDWHGHKPKSEARETIASCDVLLLCGDIFEPFNSNDKLENYFKELKKTGKRIVMTPGNHDFGIYFAQYPLESVRRDYRVSNCKRFPVEYLKEELGIDCLIDETIEIDGIKIHGTPWTPMFCNWAFMLLDNEDMMKKHESIPSNLDILICHGPPLDEKSKIDSCCPSIYTGQPEHLGSKVLFETIGIKQPKWFFCGHIHSGQHEETIIGNTRCYNVSYLGEDYEPHYPVFVLDI